MTPSTPCSCNGRAEDRYELLDFGAGRRLERFGPVVLDRPCPAAEGLDPSTPDAWAQADARFDGRDQEKGRWTDRREVPNRWTVAFGPLQFELKRTDFGHLGLFPEQAENWDWIARVLSSCDSKNVAGDKNESVVDGQRSVSSAHNSSSHHSLSTLHSPLSTASNPQSLIPNPSPNSPHPRPLSQRERGDGNPVKILNLFAYTGGSTLAAGAAGAEVVHIDAAQNVVAWARRNAELSGLADARIRWIAEDALKFVKRELKRGNRYDAVILDPPSYGHGPHGEVWRLSRDLPRLVSLCAELTDTRPAFMLLTCHTPGYDADQLRQILEECGFATASGCFEARPLGIRAIHDRILRSGMVVRWRRPNP